MWVLSMGDQDVATLSIQYWCGVESHHANPASAVSRDYSYGNYTKKGQLEAALCV